MAIPKKTSNIETNSSFNIESIEKAKKSFSLEEWAKNNNIDISKYNDKQKEELVKHLKQNPFFYMKGIDLNTANLEEKVHKGLLEKYGFKDKDLKEKKEEFKTFLNSKQEFVDKVVKESKNGVEQVVRNKIAKMVEGNIPKWAGGEKLAEKIKNGTVGSGTLIIAGIVGLFTAGGTAGKALLTYGMAKMFDFDLSNWFGDWFGGKDNKDGNEKKGDSGKDEKENSSEQLGEEKKEENENKEILGETKKSIYSKTGFNILKTFSPNPFEEGDDPTNIFQKLSKNKKLNFNDLEKKYLETKQNGKKEIKINGIELDGKEIFKGLKVIFHDYSFSIYQSKLTNKNIKNILNQKNINEIFNQNEIEEIKKNITQESFEYRNLNISIISRLVALSFKGILGAGLFAVKNNMKGFYNYLVENNNGLLKDIESEINSRKDDLLSPKTWEIIKGKDTGLMMFGGTNRVKLNKNDFLKDYSEGKDYTEKEVEQLNKFLSFRDNLLQNIGKYDLGLGEEFKKSFNAGLNIGKIAILYTLLDGKNIDELDDYEKANVYIWITEILKKDNGKNDISGKYMGIFSSEALKENSTIFTKNQQKIIKIILLKIGKHFDDSFKGKLKQNFDFVNQNLQSLLPDYLNNKQKEIIIELIEGGALLALIGYLVFGKKNFTVKFILASSGIIGGLAFLLTSKKMLDEVKESISEDNYKRFEKELNKLLKNNPIEITPKGGGTVTINSIEMAQKVREGKSQIEINKEQLKGKYLYLGSDGKLHVIQEKNYMEFSEKEPIFIKNEKDGFHVIYKRNKMFFDTQTNYASQLIEHYTGGEKKDKFRGFDLYFKNIDIDNKEQKIKFGGDNYSLNIKDIVEKLKKGRLKKDFSGKVHYYVIDSNSNGDDKLILSYQT